MSNGNQLTIAQAAKLAGMKPAMWRAYTSPNSARGGRLRGPAPDDRWPCGCPWWYRATVERWVASRAG